MAGIAPRRPPPSSARRRPWRARWRDCAAGGDPPKHSVPLDLARTALIRSYRFGPQRAVDSVHRVCVSTSLCHVVHRTNSQPPRGHPVNSQDQTGVSSAHFSENPLCFHRIKPRYSSVQINFYSVLVLFNLAPVFSRFNARSPRTCYSMILFKFKFVLFTELPLHLISCITFAF